MSSRDDLIAPRGGERVRLSGRRKVARFRLGKKVRDDLRRRYFSEREGSNETVVGSRSGRLGSSSFEFRKGNSSSSDLVQTFPDSSAVTKQGVTGTHVDEVRKDDMGVEESRDQDLRLQRTQEMSLIVLSVSYLGVSHELCIVREPVIYYLTN